MDPNKARQPHPPQPSPHPQQHNNDMPALRADIVSNIPVKSQNSPDPKPVKNADMGLNEIIHKVDTENKTAPKNSVFSKKPEPAESTRESADSSQHQPKPAGGTSKTPRSAPVLIIFVAIVVTALLAAAAYYAYK